MSAAVFATAGRRGVPGLVSDGLDGRCRLHDVRQAQHPAVRQGLCRLRFGQPRQGRENRLKLVRSPGRLRSKNPSSATHRLAHDPF